MTQMGTSKESTTKILSIRQIARWWLHKSLKYQAGQTVWAELPIIQRGFIWDANRIERLWDSIARRFPLGSILLQEFNQTDMSHGKKIEGEGDITRGAIKELENENYFLLLDGQQRATSIALGFKNIWKEKSVEKAQDDWRGLWVDIACKPKDERSFLFRLNTKAHPWGYARAVDAGRPPRRIPAEDMRAALDVFKYIWGHADGESSNVKSSKAHEVPARVAFPWDAEAPVPVTLILECLMDPESGRDNTNLAECLLAKMELLPLWKLLEHNQHDMKGKDTSIKKALSAATLKFIQVKDILEHPTGSNAKLFNDLINGLRHGLNKTEIPAPVLMAFEGGDGATENVDIEDKHDPAFNLFERINTAGKALTREEINYSMLKSAWKEAAETIDKLLDERQLTHPARLVSLLSRLKLTVDNPRLGKESPRGGLQDALSIAQFRREIQTGLKDKLRTFCEKISDESVCNSEAVLAQDVLDATWRLLTNDPWSLPPVLASNITGHQEDLMLLLMVWIYRLMESGTTYDDLDEGTRRRTLGFITAIHWFSPDSSGCVKKLGEELISCERGCLIKFFNHERYANLLQPDAHAKQVMILLPSHASLRDFLQSISKDNKLPEPIDANLWHLYFVGNDEAVKKWSNGIGTKEFAHTLLKKIYDDRRLVLYAQRKYIKNWFEWFDPTHVDRITDHNVPWDFDHILPWSWVGGERISANTTKLLRIWIHSNGNFRAWPAEYNRSKGNHHLLESELPDYDIGDKKWVCDASFINNYDRDWSRLDKLGLEGGKNASVEFWEGHDENFETFTWAAINRTVDIYQEWYKQLCINELNPV